MNTGAVRTSMMIARPANNWLMVLGALGCVLCLPTGYAVAQTGGGYSITWATIDTGAATATGGGYTLQSIGGQPDAAPAIATGGGYTVTGGFLQPALFKSITAVQDWGLY